MGAVAVSVGSNDVEIGAASDDWPAMTAARDRLRSAFALLEQTVFDMPEHLAKPAEVSLPAGSQRIVAIDDSPVALKIYRRLEGEIGNCAVIGFSFAIAALRWCETENVDLVIVDFVMPDLDGIEFLRRFRSLPGRESVPVLMITSERQRDVRHRALDLGASDFLTKPVDLIELISRTRNMLALRRQQVQLANTADFMAEQAKLAIRDIAAREREAIFWLSRATEFRDTESGSHIVRMAHYCKTIADAAGLSGADAEEILAAAPMHDVGKVAVPDSILLKPGKLTPEEFELMKRHTTVGYHILRHSPAQLLQTAALIALTHHEKYDGSGYPNGLRGDDIPCAGRICAISDVFDALTSNRPYKRAWGVDESVAEIHRLSGEHFDPRLVSAFDAALPQILKHKEEYSDEVLTNQLRIELPPFLRAPLPATGAAPVVSPGDDP